MKKEERDINKGVRLIFEAELAKREIGEAEKRSEKKEKELDEFLEKIPTESVELIWLRIERIKKEGCWVPE